MLRLREQADTVPGLLLSQLSQRHYVLLVYVHRVLLVACPRGWLLPRKPVSLFPAFPWGGGAHGPGRFGNSEVPPTKWYPGMTTCVCG